MCIAILNTKGVTLKREVLNNCWKNNGDGAGLLYMQDGKMQVFKEMNSFDNFYNEYVRVRKAISKQNIVLHFRISTHGKVNETNCHPFLVHEGLGFVHNGMIYNAPESKDFSDTYMFNETILKYLVNGFEYSEDILDMLHVYIGTGSKLIFLNSEDDYAIVNEKAGHWHLNCWFSNTSYQQVNDWVDYGGIKKYKSGSYSYGAYGTAKSSGIDSSFKYSAGFYDDWYDDVRTYRACSGCDISLYDVNEINRGTCEYCHEEQLELLKEEKEDICGYCENDFGPYNKSYESHLCLECYADLEGINTEGEYHNVAFDEIYKAEQREFIYNKNISALECITENGTYFYDRSKKMWLRKTSVLGA